MSNEWINLFVLFVAKGLHPYLHTLGAERQTLQNGDLHGLHNGDERSDQFFRGKTPSPLVSNKFGVWIECPLPQHGTFFASRVLFSSFRLTQAEVLSRMKVATFVGKSVPRRKARCILIGSS